MSDKFVDFTDRTILITGAASGMGEVSARSFAANGGAVVLADINEKRAREIADEITVKGGKAIAVKVDVTNYNEIAHAVELGEQTFGSVDVTISFAGGEPARMLQQTGEFAEQPVELIDWGLAINGRAPVYMARAVLPGMMARKRGVIINISSIDGVAGGAIVYSTAKSGLIGFTKSLANYAAPYGIRACCVAPGPVLTRPGMANMKTCLGRAAEPQEVVDLVMYLASDKAAFITGDTYLIDGGRNCLYK